MILLTFLLLMELIFRIVKTKNIFWLILIHGGKNESSAKFPNASYS